MHAPSPLSRRTRVAARKLLFVPVAAAGLAIAPPPATAGDPTAQGDYSSQGQVEAAPPADPPAHGRPVGVQTGRRPR